MDKSKKKELYVSVGHPALPMPLACRVKVFSANPAKVGTDLRRQISRHLSQFGFVEEISLPADDFYYAVFSGINEEKPIKASDNYFWKFGARAFYGDPPVAHLSENPT